MDMVTKWMKTGKRSEKLSYVLETGAGFGGEIGSALPELKKKFPYQAFTYGAKKEILPLQSADVLAYETYKYLVNNTDGVMRKPLRKSFERLVSVPQVSFYYDKDGLNKYIQKVAQAQARGR